MLGQRSSQIFSQTHEQIAVKTQLLYMYCISCEHPKGNVEWAQDLKERNERMIYTPKSSHTYMLENVCYVNVMVEKERNSSAG